MTKSSSFTYLSFYLFLNFWVSGRFICLKSSNAARYKSKNIQLSLEVSALLRILKYNWELLKLNTNRVDVFIPKI